MTDIAGTEGFASALSETYRIERLIGRGGMALVYLAHDVRHSRRVAVKVMSAELGAAVGAERFLQEIRTTAALQHPHILPLIDSGEAAGLLYYVTPFVDGESLRDRLDREKQLPVAEAVRLAREVAAALDYAHRNHVVHRDVKPENVLLQDGQALVADFGIALALSSAGGTRLTQTGVSLGTPLYMAPEQITGERSIDARSDIYALGAIVYEMLAGEPPFGAPTSQAIAARVLTEEVRPLASLRKSVPAHVDAAVACALEKLPADRFTTAKEFGDALALDSGAFVHRTRDARRRGSMFIAGGTLAIGAALVAAWMVGRRAGASRTPPQPPSRLSLVVPRLGATGANSLHRQLAITPDGSTLLYIAASADGAAQVVRQPLDAAEGTPVPGVRSGTTSLALSYDGRWLLGWLKGAHEGYRYPITGGAGEPVTLTAGQTDFVDWDEHGTIWFSPINGGGFARLDAGDSAAHFIDAGRGLRLQHFLPDGRYALAMARATTQSGPVVILDSKTGNTTPLLPGQVVEARYAAGYLIYVLGNGNLQVAPFDASKRRITGPAVSVGQGVSVSGAGLAQIAVARNGTIAYLSEEPQALELVDRAGTVRAALDVRHNYHGPRFSPDGLRVAVDFNSTDGRDVWVFDVASPRLTRATFDRDGHDAVWMPDGRDITYVSARTGAIGLYRRHPGSAETIAPLFSSALLGFSGLLLPDGSAMVTAAIDLKPNSGADIGIVQNGGRGPLVPLIATEFTEAFPALSPDGKWIAYSSDQSGRPEVYVRPLDGSSDAVQVSLDGGTESVWGPSGRELLYRSIGEREPQLIDAEVQVAPTFSVSSRRALFSMADVHGTNPHVNLDISPDGKTFVLVRRSLPTRITVIQNLSALVARLQAAGESK